LFEIMAVIVLMTVVFAVATGYFTSGASRLRSAGYQLTQDIESLYQASIKKAKIYRLVFLDDGQTYQLQELQPPLKKPKEEDKEAYEKWKEAQKALDALNPSDRKEMTSIQRGNFKTLKTRKLPRSILVKSFLTTRKLDDPSETNSNYLF